QRLLLSLSIVGYLIIYNGLPVKRPKKTPNWNRLMRWIKYSLVLLSLSLCLFSPYTSAEENQSGGLMSILQKLGMSTDQTDQELLPPDEAFKLKLEVRDEHTVIAHLTPAKDYYLYRDKIAFESKSAGI